MTELLGAVRSIRIRPASSSVGSEPQAADFPLRTVIDRAAEMREEEPEVRSEVESLLRAHEAHPDFLEPPEMRSGAANDASNSDTSAAWVGRVLGSYRLQR